MSLYCNKDTFKNVSKKYIFFTDPKLLNGSEYNWTKT